MDLEIQREMNDRALSPPATCLAACGHANPEISVRFECLGRPGIVRGRPRHPCRAKRKDHRMQRRSARHLLKGVSAASLLIAIFLVSAGSVQAAALPTLSLTVNASSIAVGGTLQSGGVNVV